MVPVLPQVSRGHRLLMIGLDAADPVLVDQWLGEGLLPNLAALRARGTEMRLETSARHLAGSPWPTFFTGQYPTNHGLYADFQWRPDQMEFAAPTPDWLIWRCSGVSLRATCPS